MSAIARHERVLMNITPKLQPKAQPSFPHMGKFISFHDVTGRRATMPDISSRLSLLSIHDVLRLTSLLLNTFVRTGFSKRQQREFQNLLLDQLFSDELKLSLRKSDFVSDFDMVIFYPQQLLMVTRRALTSCPDVAPHEWGPDSVHRFAEICLMMNDLAGAREDEFPEGAGLLEMASIMLPITELMADTEIAGLVGRSNELWLTIPAEPAFLAHEKYVPFPERFEAKYGSSLEQFIHCLYLCLAQIEHFNPGDPNPHNALVFNLNLLPEEPAFPRAAFGQTLRLISCPLSEMRERAENAIQSIRYDFSLFRRYPVVEVETDIFLCLHRGFLSRLFTDGIYIMVSDALDTEEKRRFQSYFGALVEEYVDRLLKARLSEGPSKSLVLAGPRFSGSRAQVCDDLVVSENTWCVIESKGSLLTPHEKYSMKTENLQNGLYAKFANPPGAAPKGIGQAANSIRKFLDGGTLAGAEAAFSDCKGVYPVLVSYDPSITDVFISLFLFQVCDELIGKKPDQPPIWRASILSINDLEVFSALKKSYQLNHVLAAYRRFTYPAEPLSTFIHRYYRRDERRAELKNTLFWKSFQTLHTAVEKFLKAGASTH
jgi:hypothetical protein